MPRFCRGFLLQLNGAGARIESLSHRPYNTIIVQVIASGISNKKRIKNNQNNENTHWILSEYYGIIWSEKNKGMDPLKERKNDAKDEISKG